MVAAVTHQPLVDSRVVSVQKDLLVHVRRNCSLSPRAAMWIIGATAAVSFAIGVGFAAVGLWMVLPFAGAEVLALALAFYVCGRHAGDYERIELLDGMLALEIRDGTRILHHQFNPHWVRVESYGADAGVWFAEGGRRVRIGRHLDEAGRSRLAAALQSRIGLIRSP